ncbi:MAG: hypothetical protein AAF945_01715 [Actinomycetota bacterium]
MPTRRLVALACLIASMGLLDDSAGRALPPTPELTLVELTLDGRDLLDVAAVSADASTLVASANGTPPSYVVDLANGVEEGPFSNTTRLNANGDYRFESAGPTTIERVERSSGTSDTVDAEVGNDYFVDARTVLADDSGDLVAFTASSGTLARSNGFVVDASSGAVLTPGAAGINTTGVANSSILHVDPAGEFVTYSDFLVGGQPTYFRWNLEDGSRIRLDPPIDLSSAGFIWQASPSLDFFAYLATGGVLKVVERATGTESVLPDTTAGLRTFAVTDSGALVYTRDAPTQAEGNAPLLFGWTPTDTEQTLLSATFDDSVPQTRVENVSVSADGSAVVFTAFGDNFVEGTTGFDRRMYIVRLDDPTPRPDIARSATASTPAVRVGS